MFGGRGKVDIKIKNIKSKDKVFHLCLVWFFLDIAGILILFNEYSKGLKKIVIFL